MRYAFIFGGQGSQCVGMGREFFENSLAAREVFLEACEAVKSDLKAVMFEPNELLGRSDFTQSAVLLNAFMALSALKERAEVESVVNFGHSLGEFGALGASGAFSFSEGVALVKRRGELMMKACEGGKAGMMVVLGLADSVVEGVCEKSRNGGGQIWAANYNCDGQIVVAGLRADLAAVEGEFKASGAKRAMLLDMSVASHCPLLHSVGEPLGVELGRVLRDEFLPVVSNVTARAYTTKGEALRLLGEQLVKPVLFKQSVAGVAGDVDVFVEFGSSVLKGILKKITDKPVYSITNMASLEEFVKTLA